MFVLRRLSFLCLLVLPLSLSAQSPDSASSPITPTAPPIPPISTPPPTPPSDPIPAPTQPPAVVDTPTPSPAPITITAPPPDLSADSSASPSASPTPSPSETPTPSPPIHGYTSASLIPIPWKEGETLTYHVMWGVVDAADGTFVTRSDDDDKWSCTLSLKSRGAVDTMYPFHDDFTTSILKSPWRSLSYTEDRHEPGRVLTDITEVNYISQNAARLVANKSKGTTENHNFTFPYDAMDDLGSMLLHLRAFHWSVGEKHKLYVYENNSSKEGDAECVAIESRAFGDWPSQSLIEVHAVPGKGTHRHGWLTVWMTNDGRRLPIHADLNFYYGTFAIDLTKFVRSTPKPVK